MPDREQIIKRLKSTLDSERFGHSLRVEKIALALGKKWRVDQQKIIPAALLHDCGRRYDRPGLLRQARKLGLTIDRIRKFEPKLFHAEISARLARTEFKVRSSEVLCAIRHHTVGAPKMSKLDQIIYLADHLEAGRNFAGVRTLRALAFKDLDRAVFESTSSMLKHLLSEKLPIYPGTVETRNYFITRL